MRLVDELERRIRRRYDLEVAHPVREFLLHDPDVLHALADGAAAQGARAGGAEAPEELVLVRGADGVFELTLYLSETVCRRAGRALERGELGGGGLDAVCTLVEGVSHAVCLLWHAQHGRALRPLDLELQADIDKYLVLARDLAMGEGLREALFEDVAYRAPAGSALEARYRTANGSAARYCRFLEHRYRGQGSGRALAAELARFYRLSGNAKLRRIRDCASGP